MPEAIFIFLPPPESCMPLSEQTRSGPRENPHPCPATLSSLLLPWGTAPLPSGLSATHGFSSASPPAGPASPGAKPKHGHLLSDTHTRPSPQRGWHAAVPLEGSRCGHLPSKAHVWPSPLWGPDMAVSPVRPRHGCLPSEAQTWPSPQEGPDMAVTPVRPRHGRLPGEAQGASAATLGAVRRRAQRRCSG